MEASVEDQFRKLRAQILDTQEMLYVYWRYLSRNPRDLATLGMYEQAITVHHRLRAEVDLLYPPGKK